MSRVGVIEAAVVNRLTAALTLPGKEHPKVEVRPWPEKARDYRMTHPHGAVLVLYRGARMSSRAAAGQLVDMACDVQIGIASRTLREPNAAERDAAVGVSAYDLLDTCRLALMGWQPEGASGAVSVTAEAFDDYLEGVWHYHLEATVPATLVVDRPDPLGPWAMSGPNALCADAPPLTTVNTAAST